MALTKQKLLMLREQQRGPAAAPDQQQQQQQQRMESIVAPKRMGRRQSVIERLQTRSVPPGADGGSGLSGVDAVVASLPASTCQLCGPGSLCGPGCVGRSMPAGAITPAPTGDTAAPPRRMGRRQSVIERLQAGPEPGGADNGVGGGGRALSGVNAVVASLPMSVCQLCGPGSLCGPGCVGRSAPAGAIPSSGPAAGVVGGARRAARRGSVVDRLSMRPDGSEGPDRLQSFASKKTQKTVNLAIGGGDGGGLSPGTDDTGDEMDTPGSTRSSSGPPMRMGRRASVVVEVDGAKTIVPVGPTAKKSSFGVASFGKQVAKAKSRDWAMGSVREEQVPPTVSPVGSTGAAATARPEIGAATTREGVEMAFGSALKSRMQEYEKGCAQAMDFKLKYFAKNLEKRLNRHSGDVADVAAAISAVVAEEMPRTLDELATVAGKQGGTARGRALSSQLIAAALDQTAEVWRIRRRAAVRVSETDPELLADLFNKIDTDGSGYLDRDEIAQLSIELGKPLSEAELDDAMLSMDADGSGEVDLEEFVGWFEAMKAAGKMPSWGAALAELQAKMRAEKEKEMRVEMMAGQTAGAEAVQQMEAELAAARAKRRADEANQSEAEAAAENDRIAKMASQATESAETKVLREKMLAAGRELAEVDHSIREQRSKLQACEARLSKLRQQEAQKEKAAAAGFNKAGKFDDA
jgi:hypothetical protein